MEPARTLCWFSAGAASAVATKLAIQEARRDGQTVEAVYCATNAEHPDNVRFITDCAVWFGQPIVQIKSDKYADTWDVWKRERWLNGPKGAKCTGILKKLRRLVYQRPFDRHVFGYTADEAPRFEKFKANFPELDVRAPLIEAGLTKANVLAMVQGANIRLPTMYLLGFHNNNCIPCVKAQSPSYWALIRKEFPAEFERMALLSRELKVRLCKIKGERRYIDEIPLDQPTTNPISPACDFMCGLAELESAA